MSYLSKYQDHPAPAPVETKEISSMSLERNSGGSEEVSGKKNLFEKANSIRKFLLPVKAMVVVVVLLFAVQVAKAVTYYSGGSVASYITTSWWTNTNGTGSNPANFTTAGNIFIIQAAHTMTTSAAWTVTGVGSGVQVSGTLVASFAVSAPTWTFNSGSTYTHAQNGGTIPTATWNAASTCNITGITSTAPGGLGQTFGNFTLTNGTLVLNYVTSYASSITTVNSPGILELTSTNTTVDNWRLNTILAGNGTINKTGIGWIQTFTNANTFSGTFNVQAGTFGTSYLNSDWTGVTADFNVSAGALLDAHGQAITVGSLGGAGNVGTTWNTVPTVVTTGAGNKSGTFSGIISGDGSSGTNNTANPNGSVLSLVKIGTGTQTLSGANTYTGATTITLGELRLNPSADITPNTQIVLKEVS